MSNINKKNLLYMAAFLLGGCINEHNIASEIKNEVGSTAKILVPKTCNIPTDAFKKLPTEVLDGTDVVEISSFKSSTISGSHFHTEMGGSTIKIDVQTLTDQYQITRIYKEPDLQDMTSNYKNLCINAEHLYGEHVRGVFTEKGILWLELKSDIEFISPDMWIYLEKN
ncbi:hypothetical protein [Cellvibrio sp. KY-YJ-3]|uniref:hypothetical protein n=1 Tax=Cellvibrio sp. KY-YJ-3 TaxID=454662 RepID=UPI001244FC1D|nr:hypothetical protein [Cellvibrio sp. KY-YJ-3]